MAKELGGKVEPASTSASTDRVRSISSSRRAFSNGMRARMDEPWRPDTGAASGISGHRADRDDDGGDGESRHGRSSAFNSIRKSRTRDNGTALLRRFIFDICGCQGDWTIGSFIESAIARIREQIGNGRAICAISGGVDSTVAATLVSQAIGDRLIGVFVNNGLLRKNEFEKVLSMLQNNLHLNVRGVDAAERFLNLLAGVTDPEKKRKIIGDEFIRVFEEEAQGDGIRRFSGSGNALSGRHRIGFGERTFADDQVASQCRRTCRNGCT